MTSNDWRLEKSPALDPLATDEPESVSFQEVDDLLSEAEVVGHFHTFLNGWCSGEELGEAVESLLTEIRARKREEVA